MNKLTTAERVKRLVALIEREQAAIGKRRDKLRAIVDDLEEVLSSIDEADEALTSGLADIQRGVDHLSERL